MPLQWKTRRQSGFMRYRRSCEKVAVKSSDIQPQTLPPTSATARYHSMRVDLQVQERMGVSHMRPVDWGWMMSDGDFVPVITYLPPALDALLHVIQRNCSTDCNTARFKCRKNIFVCHPAYGQCRGSGFSNSVLGDLILIK